MKDFLAMIESAEKQIDETRVQLQKVDLGGLSNILHEKRASCDQKMRAADEEVQTKKVDFLYIIISAYSLIPYNNRLTFTVSGIKFRANPEKDCIEAWSHATRNGRAMWLSQGIGYLVHKGASGLNFTEFCTNAIETLKKNFDKVQHDKKEIAHKMLELHERLTDLIVVKV